MSRDPTDRLVEELGRDLEPVRRVGPLWRSVLLWVGGVSALGAGYLAMTGLRPDLAELMRDGGTEAIVVVALAIAGFSGALSALAESRPDRELLARVSAGIAVAGLGWAAGSALAAWWSSGHPKLAPDALDRMCMTRSLLLALPLGAGLGLVLLRGWIGRPVRAAILAGCGAAACGSLLVHLHCDCDTARHVLLGHVAPALLWVAVGALPLTAWMRHSGR